MSPKGFRPKGFRQAPLQLIAALMGAGLRPDTTIKARATTAPRRIEPKVSDSYPWCMRHQKYCRPGSRKHKRGMTYGHVQKGGQPY